MLERIWMKLFVGLMFAQIALGLASWLFPKLSTVAACTIGFAVGALTFYDLCKVNISSMGYDLPGRQAEASADQK